MPRAHPLFRPFAHALVVENQTFEWTTHSDDFCFRPRSAPLDVVWVLPGRSDYASHLALEQAHSRVEPHIISASLKISRAWRGQTCWRFWPLSGGEELLVRPLFALLRTRNGQSAQFQLPRYFDCDRADAPAMAAWMNVVNAPDSDLQAARRWLQLTLAQRLAQLVRVSGGTWDEIIALLRAAFVLWARPDSRLELDFTSRGQIWLKRSPHWASPHETVDDALETLSLHWYLLRVDLTDARRYWRGCDRFGDPMDIPQPRFVHAETSSHERLEALLLWRNWLRDKDVSPAFAELWEATIN